MEPDKRLEVFVAAVVATALIIHFLNLSHWPLILVREFGVSFVLSGIFYVLLRSIGLDFLEEIQIGFVSAMTIIIFALKLLLLR